MAYWWSNNSGVGLLLAVAVMISSCSLPAGKGGSQGEGAKQMAAVKPDKERKYFIEEVEGIALVQLYADGFEKLPLREKLLAYYLYKAAVAGRDMTYDQNHRHALTIRHLLDQILTHPLGLPPGLEDKILKYAKLFWLNNGPYYERNKTKFTATFERHELLEALGIARANGADLNFPGRTLEEVVLELEPVLFDPAHEPLVTNKNPGKGGDILRDSAGNYYHGVTMADLEGFDEKYPLNSRLVKECPRKKPCTVVEQVYRAGQKAADDSWAVEPGVYAAPLAELISHLEKAAWFAPEGQAETLRFLANYLRTGDPATFDQASISWLKSEPQVDVIIGFIETYKDPRSQKGEFEGLVYYTDPENSALMEGVAENVAYFEEQAPWSDKYKKEHVAIPVASAINVLLGVGGAGPNIPAGINLPNAQWIREKHGSRSVLLTNVTAAAQAAISDRALEEFALPLEVAPAKKYRENIGRTMVALHEIVGHGSGKVNPDLKEDPSFYLKETYSALEETRAELVALHHIFDPKLVELGAVSGPEAAAEAYRGYLRHGLLQLRRVKEGSRFEDDHMRATHLIVQYLLANEDAAEVRKVDGKTYYALKDLDEARDSVAELLKEVMRIKGEGDLEAGRALVAKYAVDFDPGLRDEIVARAKSASVPDFVAFHQPGVKLVLDDSGEPVDVVLDYSNDFVSTMLEWDLVGAR